ncbi:hypothetical protein [Thiohalocapsa marina]|uniref:hypothetical protein n=1 Tax=Thiohalocapsa marina TaxID=424902 RepID=UPI0036DBAFCA
MAAAETLRIQVCLSAQLHPELFAVLAPLPPRRRAERLRQLTLLGLVAQGRPATEAGVRGGAILPQALPEGAPDRADPQLEAQRAGLLGALSLTD